MLPFVQDYVSAMRVEAFVNAQRDILETMNDDIGKRSDELADAKLQALLSVVDYKKVVTIDKQRGIVFVGTDKLSPEKLANIKAEAEFFASSELWQLIHESPKASAEKAMFISGESMDDMKKGRSVLYTLSQQKNILELFRGYDPKK